MEAVARSFALAAFIAAPLPALVAGDPNIPANAKHDRNLGATGLRGWMYCDQMATSDARQIAITKVDQGSPAAGVIAIGDVILGVSGKPFACDPRTELDMALTVAETEVGGGKLALTRWRAGKAEEVVVRLPVLTSYHVREKPWDKWKQERTPCVTFATAGWDTRPRQERPPPWCSWVRATPDPTPTAQQRPLIDATTATPGELAAHLREAIEWTKANHDLNPSKVIIIYGWKENDEGGWLVPTLGADGRPDDARINALGKVLRLE